MPPKLKNMIKPQMEVPVLDKGTLHRGGGLGPTSTHARRGASALWHTNISAELRRGAAYGSVHTILPPPTDFIILTS